MLRLQPATGNVTFPGPRTGPFTDLPYTTVVGGTAPWNTTTDDTSYVEYDCDVGSDDYLWACAPIAPAEPVELPPAASSFGVWARASASIPNVPTSMVGGLYDATLGSSLTVGGSGTFMASGSAVTETTPVDTQVVREEITDATRPAIEAAVGWINAGAAYLGIGFPRMAGVVYRVYAMWIEVDGNPILRVFPRSDGLGLSSARRVWPPSKAAQDKRWLPFGSGYR